VWCLVFELYWMPISKSAVQYTQTIVHRMDMTLTRNFHSYSLVIAFEHHANIPRTEWDHLRNCRINCCCEINTKNVICETAYRASAAVSNYSLQTINWIQRSKVNSKKFLVTFNMTNSSKHQNSIDYWLGRWKTLRKIRTTVLYRKSCNTHHANNDDTTSLRM
jgi:hypothetical protein